jgi:membrane-associated phospholipid phosphatase
MPLNVTRWVTTLRSQPAVEHDAAPQAATANMSSTRPPWRLLAVMALLLAAPAAVIIDCPLARWCHDDNCPRLARDFLGLCELFGHGLGLVVIALAIHQLDPLRRRVLPLVIGAALGSGLTANVIKLLVNRTRPRCFDFDTGVWASFAGWFPLLSAGSGGQSFPSAHVATAAGLAVALTWLYPAGRNFFLILVFLVACQRLEASSHYLSDVLVGAAVGFLIGATILRLGGRGVDALEAGMVAPSGGKRRAPAVG